MAEIVRLSASNRRGLQQQNPSRPPVLGAAWAQAPQQQSPPPLPMRAWGAGPCAPQAHAPGEHVIEAGIRHKELAPYGAAAVKLQERERRLAEQERIRQSVKDVAASYQKAAAIRSAEGALRPWSPHVGLGERRGAVVTNWIAQAYQPGGGAAEAAATPGGSPSRFQLPDAAQAEAYASAAGRVARMGTGQVNAPGAYSPVPGHPARELWPRDVVEPPKYCAGCRGEHDPHKERNPAWEPYTPRMRLENLNALQSRFVNALLRGQLCVALNDGSRVAPVKWTRSRADAEGDMVTVKPESMGREEFVEQMTLMFEGLREGHEPYRHLATQAASAFLDSGSRHLLAAAPALCKPLALALNTYEPHLVGHALLMLQRLIRCHASIGPVLVPHLKSLLPVMALFRPRHFVVHLPPPFCVSPAGSFTGNGVAPEVGSRSCRVCGCPIDKEFDSACAVREAEEQAVRNPLRASQQQQRAVKAYNRHPLSGRWSRKYTLEAVINDTLDLMVAAGGPRALAAVKRYVPTYDYYDPKD